jgi:hypothetical protein
VIPLAQVLALGLEIFVEVGLDVVLQVVRKKDDRVLLGDGFEAFKDRPFDFSIHWYARDDCTWHAEAERVWDDR